MIGIAMILSLFLGAVIYGRSFIWLDRKAKSAGDLDG